MRGFGVQRTWNRLALVGLVLSGTACGNSAGRPGAGDTTMQGVLGMSERFEFGPTAYASYSREVDDCSGSFVGLGECAVVRDCPVDQVPGFFDAGAVTIAGNPLMYADGYFANLSGPVPYGQLIVAEAAGSDEVPAHSLSLTFPEPSVVVEPSLDGLVIDRTRDLVVRWDGGSGETVFASVNAGTGIRCLAAMSAGSITFPSSLLAELEPTNADATGSLAVSQGASTITTKGEWALGFYASLELARIVAVVE